jgi:hypothetical protein
MSVKCRREFYAVNLDVKFLSHRKINAFGPRLFFDVDDDDDDDRIVKSGATESRSGGGKKILSKNL